MTLNLTNSTLWQSFSNLSVFPKFGHNTLTKSTKVNSTFKFNIAFAPRFICLDLRQASMYSITSIGRLVHNWRKITLHEKIGHHKEGQFIAHDNILTFLTEQPLYDIRSDWARGWRKRTLRNDHGLEIYKINTPPLSPRGVQRVKCASSGSIVATITRKGFLPASVKGAGTLHVWRTGSVHHWLEISGVMHGRNFPIRQAASGNIIAFIRRKRVSLASFIPGAKRSSYAVYVKDGQDLEFMLLLAVAVDHHFEKGRA